MLHQCLEFHYAGGGGGGEECARQKANPSPACVLPPKLQCRAPAAGTIDILVLRGVACYRRGIKLVT